MHLQVEGKLQHGSRHQRARRHALLEDQYPSNRLDGGSVARDERLLGAVGSRLAFHHTKQHLRRQILHLLAISSNSLAYNEGLCRDHERKARRSQPEILYALLVDPRHPAQSLHISIEGNQHAFFSDGL